MNLIPASILAATVVASSDTAGLLINILILAIVLVVAFWIIGKMAAPNPISTILRLIVGIIGLIWLLNLVGAIGGHPFMIYHN
jgi:Co/Zn/Cd efflux system component